MRKYFLIFTVYGLAALLLAGCPKNDQKTAEVPAATAFGGASCPANTTWNSWYCVNPNGTFAGCPSNYSYNGASCVPTSVLEYGASNYAGGVTSFEITNGDVYRAILRSDLRACEQQSGGRNWGASNCNTWVGGFRSLIMKYNGVNTMSLHLFAKSRVTYSGGINFQNPFKADLNNYDPSYSNVDQNGWAKARFDLRVTPINNNTGFEAKTFGSGYGQYVGSTRFIQMQVTNAQIGADRLDFVLYYNSHYTAAQGVEFARGSLVKCGTPNCTAW